MLLALRRPEKALEELDDADRLTKIEQIRRHAYIDILRARAYFLKGAFDFATQLALGALQICLSIHSDRKQYCRYCKTLPFTVPDILW